MTKDLDSNKKGLYLFGKGIYYFIENGREFKNKEKIQ